MYPLVWNEHVWLTCLCVKDWNVRSTQQHKRITWLVTRRSHAEVVVGIWGTFKGPYCIYLEVFNIPLSFKYQQLGIDERELTVIECLLGKP